MADHYLGGGGALVVGIAAGSLSTYGYVVVQPWLEDKVGLFDTCGVHNLHGMPGVLGGLAAVVSAACAGKSLYGDNAGLVFPDMAGESGISGAAQAGRQAAALAVTLAMAVASGTLTGKLLASGPGRAVFDPPSELFNDVANFEVPEDGPRPAGDSELDLSVGEPIPESEWRPAPQGGGPPPAGALDLSTYKGN